MKIRKDGWITYWAIVVITCALTSCFEIREEITIAKDGSGSYALIIDMSASKSMIDLAMSMPIAKDRTPFQQIDSSFAKGIAKLSQIKGITHPRAIDNRQEYIFGMAFDFDNVEALNAALNQSTQQEGEVEEMPTFIFKKKELTRNNRPLANSLAELNVFGSTPEGAQQIQAILQGASYAYIVRPKTGKIRSFTNQQAEIKESGKIFSYRVGLLDLLKGNTSPSSTIKFKF
ncbi:MAG: hypothetical protein RMJ44_08420 [Cytophagales bacterium]|nr:hypothetical protein [Bernardetiaceae bacterium]MDW8211097.1 hypothetical protein [Cytophagales bacterium]